MHRTLIHGGRYQPAHRVLLGSMTAPHPLAAWVASAQSDPPRALPGERFPDRDEDDHDERRRRRARSGARVKRARKTATVSRVRYT